MSLTFPSGDVWVISQVTFDRCVTNLSIFPPDDVWVISQVTFDRKVCHLPFHLSTRWCLSDVWLAGVSLTFPSFHQVMCEWYFMWHLTDVSPTFPSFHQVMFEWCLTGRAGCVTNLSILPPGDIRGRPAPLRHTVQGMASTSRNWTRQTLEGVKCSSSKFHTSWHIFILHMYTHMYHTHPHLSRQNQNADSSPRVKVLTKKFSGRVIQNCWSKNVVC